MNKALSELITGLITDGVLKTQLIIDAFQNIDRKDFIPPNAAEEAYADYPLSIGFAQTISQPYTVAFMLELLEAKPGETVLDVGSGSGWTAALLGHIVSQKGRVYGVELIPELATTSKENIARYELKHVEIFEANEAELGLPEHAPYDRILVSAGDTELPQELIEQLRIGGVMVIPIEDALWRITRTREDDIDIQRFGGFSFVPLIH